MGAWIWEPLFVPPFLLPRCLYLFCDSFCTWGSHQGCEGVSCSEVGAQPPSLLSFPPSTQKLAAPPSHTHFTGAQWGGVHPDPRAGPTWVLTGVDPSCPAFWGCSLLPVPRPALTAWAGSGRGEHLGAPAPRRQAGTPIHPKSAAGACLGPGPAPGGVLHAESFVSGGTPGEDRAAVTSPAPARPPRPAGKCAVPPQSKLWGRSPPHPQAGGPRAGLCPCPHVPGAPWHLWLVFVPLWAPVSSPVPVLYPPPSDTPSSAVCPWVGGCCSPAPWWHGWSFQWVSRILVLSTGFTIVLKLLLKASAVVGRGGCLHSALGTPNCRGGPAVR